LRSRRLAAGKADPDELLERRVAHSLVRAALRGHFQVDAAPGRILGRKRDLDAHQVAEGFRLAEELVLLQFAARNFHVGERRARLGGEAEPVAVHVIAVGDLEFDFDVALIERARQDTKGLFRLQQLRLAEQLRRRGQRRSRKQHGKK
jgi:hypothetical protein